MHRALIQLVVLLTSLACQTGRDDEGTPSGATCPVDSTLTYETFGRAFLNRYCTGCHGSSLRGAERRGAPSDHDFDTLETIRSTEAEHIDERAAAGPASVNTAMPPAGYEPAPSEVERRRLGEWIACGMP